MIFDNLSQDLRFALRSFIRRPAFALTAIAIVALGIGATTTIFSVVDAVVLRKLPFPEPERLVYFDEGSHTLPDYTDWLEQFTAFESIAAVFPTQRTLLGDGAPQRITVGQATANLFPLFGILPAQGRLLTAADMTAGAQVVVLSHDFWLRQFGDDESVLGRTLQLDETSYEVVGIAPAGFRLTRRIASTSPAVWTPLDLNRADLQHRGVHVLRVAGRLGEGVTLEQARSQMTTWEQAAAELYPDQYVLRDGTIRRVPLLLLRDAETEAVRDPLFLLFGAVGLMLLIACANVANLLLARGSDRERELAVRAAVGGSRVRIAVLLLTESLLLAIAGAAAGVGLATFGVKAFVLLSPTNVPRLLEVAVDLRVLAFALAAAVVTGVFFGLLPAWYAGRTDVNEALKDGGGKASATRGHLRVKNGLVVGEIAVAFVLLVGAGLLFNSFVRLNSVDPGFNPENVTAFHSPLVHSSLARKRRRVPPASNFCGTSWIVSKHCLEWSSFRRPMLFRSATGVVAA